MMPITRTFCLGIVVTFIVHQCSCIIKTPVYRNFEDKFRNIAVSRDYVFVGGSNSKIYRLNSSLENVRETSVSGYLTNWLLDIYNEILAVCNYEAGNKSPCRNYNVRNMKLINNFTALNLEIEKPSAVYLTTRINSDDILFIASSSCLFEESLQGVCKAISIYFLTSSNPFGEFPFTSNVDYDQHGKPVDFKAIFEKDNFIYFLFNTNSTHSKLGKMCTSLDKFNSYEDTPIQCLYDGRTYHLAQHALQWNNYIYVAFTDDSSSVICRYSLDVVKDTFKWSRQERLKCPYSEDNKIFVKQIIQGFCYEDGGNCTRLTAEKKTVQALCPEVTNDDNGFCNTKLFGSVEGQLPISTDTVIFSSENTVIGSIVKLGGMLKNTFAVLYVGTTSGKIGKVFVDTESTSNRTIGSFKKVQNSFPVLDIKVNGEDVYVLTENKVVNIANKTSCNTHMSCSDCMISENPNCGWDVIEQSCNNKTNNTLWLPSAGGMCLSMQAYKQRISEKNGQVQNETIEIIFQLKPDLDLSDVQIACVNKYVYTGKEPVAKKNGDFYRCNLTVDSEPFMLNITYQRKVIASTTIQLYTCSSFRSCESCVTEKTCYWCFKEFRCVTNGILCPNENIQENNTTECPRIENQELLIHKEQTENINISMANIGRYNETNKFTCRTGTRTYNAVVVDERSLMCENVRGPTLQQSINVYYGENPIDNTAQLQVYDCRDFKECGECKYRASLGYKCFYCGSCKYDSKSNQNCQENKCAVSVTLVKPLSGPVQGGTFVTITGQNMAHSQRISVTIGGVPCTNVTVLPGAKPKQTKIICVTGQTSSSNNGSVVVSVDETDFSTPNKKFDFLFKSDIILNNFTNIRSIKAGGKPIIISGKDIAFDGNHRYKIEFCNDMFVDCIECRTISEIRPEGQMSTSNNNKDDIIQCRIDKSDVKTLTRLRVTIDTRTILKSQGNLTIFENPSIMDSDPKDAKVFRSGGSKVTFRGSGFSNVGEVRVDNVENLCTIDSDEEMICETPPYIPSDFDRRKRATGQYINIHFDNFQTQSTIYYVDDPTFEELTNVIEYKDTQSTILIKGSNILEGARQVDYVIHIGLDGKCIIKNITNFHIKCLPPKEVPRTDQSDENVVTVEVQVGRIREHLGYIKYIKAVAVMVIIIAVLGCALILALVIGGSTVYILRRRKKQAEKDFQIELQSREERIREASREEFADAQMTIRDIKTDLVTSRVPYFDYQRYAFHQLFPNLDMDTHPLIHEPMITDDNRKAIQKAMDMFDKLMTNKLFLKSLVQTLDNKVKLTMKDKAHFASLLSVGLLGNMKLFYQLINSLLSEMIKSASKKQQKILFRRFESITQRLTVNWLEMTLYDHLKTQSGMQLFMLYKATQTVIEKAPIDAVTNHCKNTLAEERLLKNRVEYETMTLHIDLNGTKEITIPVVVLDCDTISQVKHKCCTAIYKNKPASEIPRPDELELEWHHGRGGKLTLQDIDNISERSNGLVRLNTLKHYLVKDGSEMALMYRESHGDDPDEIYVNTPETDYVQDEEENQHVQGNLSSPDHIKLLMPDRSSTVEQDIHRWHLSNLTDEEKSNKEHEIGELFLNRLFHTKLILKDYIEAAFEGIMDSQSLALPVRYFLCMLDKLGKEESVDGDVLQSWKSECYATRVWASLISKPQILFDVDVPSHVEPCMDILKQVFIDSFTQGAQNVTKDASTQKLLFCKDIPDYRRLVNSFFLKVEPVADQDFWKTMDQISDVQSRELKFSKQATLHQLYSFIAKYKDEIIEDFEDKDETKDLAFGRKLEEVIELMEE